MGLFHALNQWRNTRYENHLANMKEQNRCPECYGRGYHPFSSTEFVYYATPYECPGCNGSGLYTDWNERTIDSSP